MKPGLHKAADKDKSFALPYTLFMNYVIAVFLMASYMSTRNYLFYFVRFRTRSTPK